MVCPAQAGVYPPTTYLSNMRKSLPRPGGGLPGVNMVRRAGRGFAPPRRGSTQLRRVCYVDGHVCPAQAGVYPYLTASPIRPNRLPRPGGGLPTPGTCVGVPRRFAPPRRGSTVTILYVECDKDVCPAQAGVYPSGARLRDGLRCLPRPGGGLP